MSSSTVIAVSVYSAWLNRGTTMILSLIHISSVTMCSLRVARIGETFGNGTPLHGEIVVVVE